MSSIAFGAARGSTEGRLAYARRDVVEENVEMAKAPTAAACLVYRDLRHHSDFEILADVIEGRADDAGVS